MLDYMFGNPLLAGVLKAAATHHDGWERGPMPTHVGDVVVTPTADARWFWMWVVVDDAQQVPTAGQWLRHVEGLERVKATAREHAGKDHVFFFDDAGWTYWR